MKLTLLSVLFLLNASLNAQQKMVVDDKLLHAIIKDGQTNGYLNKSASAKFVFKINTKNFEFTKGKFKDYEVKGFTVEAPLNNDELQMVEVKKDLDGLFVFDMDAKFNGTTYPYKLTVMKTGNDYRILKREVTDD